MINKKLTFGIVIGTRGFFNSKLALEVRIILLSKLGKMGYEIVILPKDETPTGVIETLEDAKKCAKLFSKNRKIIDGIIVALPNFGNEISIINAIKLSTLDVPILVQASDDYIDKVDLENRRDSFCGKLSVCNNFYQNGIPFTDTTEHTIDIESEIFTRDINFFEKVCRVVNGLRKARIGVIGTRPAAFQTVRLSEKILQASGITVIPVDLSEILFDAIKLADSDNVVKEKAEELKSYGYIPEYIKKEKILKQSKLSVIVNRWVEDNDIDAVAMQCWSSIQTNYGCAACATLSMMSEKFIPSACEADIAGAVSMYALILASGNQSAIVDWNNNYGGDREKCVIAHCSNYPKSFFSEEGMLNIYEYINELRITQFYNSLSV